MNERQLTALAALVGLVAVAAPGEVSYEKLKQKARDLIARDPTDSALAAVIVGAYLFFQAEKGHNPKVKTYGDALVFVSTCLSVGYSDIFARTEAGKVIATALMTFGPPIASNSLGAPRRETPS